jgi:hypothetical protein
MPRNGGVSFNEQHLIPCLRAVLTSGEPTEENS